MIHRRPSTRAKTAGRDIAPAPSIAEPRLKRRQKPRAAVTTARTIRAASKRKPG